MAEKVGVSVLRALFLRWPTLFSGKTQVVVAWCVSVAIVSMAIAMTGNLVTGRVFPWESISGIGILIVGFYGSILGIILALVGVIKREGRRAAKALALSFGALILSLYCGLLAERGPTHRYALEQQDLAAQEIIRSVMQDPGVLTSETHAEFWRLIDGDSLSKDELLEIRGNFADLTTPYMRLFFQDALEAYRSGQPVKSPARADYERRILASGIIGKSRIEANDRMLEKIAEREPVDDGQRIVMFDEETIAAALANIDNSLRALNILFTDPQQVWRQDEN